MITVTVPATSANVGAGFDSLGLALSMHNVFTFEECDRIRISSVDGTHVPTGANNLVYRSARAFLRGCGLRSRDILRDWLVGFWFRLRSRGRLFYRLGCRLLW